MISEHDFKSAKFVAHCIALLDDQNDKDDILKLLPNPTPKVEPQFVIKQLRNKEIVKKKERQYNQIPKEDKFTIDEVDQYISEKLSKNSNKGSLNWENVNDAEQEILSSLNSLHKGTKDRYTAKRGSRRLRIVCTHPGCLFALRLVKSKNKWTFDACERKYHCLPKH